MQLFELAFTQETPQQWLIDALVEHCLNSQQGFSKAQLKQAIQKGAVWCQSANQKQPSRARRAKKLLQLGDQVFLYYNSEVLASQVPPPTCLSTQAGYSVWYKPKGMLSQGSKWGDHTTIYRWVEQQMQQPVFIVHRLDKATDGLMLIAHSKGMAQQISQLFETHRIKKTYQAWVLGRFPEIEQRYQHPVNDKSALSFAKRLQYDSEQDRSLIEVKIETGRKHQIRQHLSQAGFPIIGDRLYGQAQADDEDLQLTAVRLELQGEEETLQQIFNLPPL